MEKERKRNERREKKKADRLGEAGNRVGGILGGAAISTYFHGSDFFRGRGGREGQRYQRFSRPAAITLKVSVRGARELSGGRRGQREKMGRG